MNILPIFANIQTRNSAPKDSLNNRQVIQPKYCNTLEKDTVSFSGSPAHKVSSIISDAIEHSYISRAERFIGYAKNFHNALKNTCTKLADEGFVYDEVYNSKHPIKSFDSYVDKYEREGSVRDLVRGTVYWGEQQDIGSFKKFLDVMKEEGYEIAVTKQYNPETGKFVKFPDLEIRQNGISQEDLEPLGSFLTKSEISKPRSSTYSDYQMRFVPIKSHGKNENKQALELIMLYGPHYSKAKELESKYVYNIARQLGKLHINLNAKYPEKSPGRRIANNVDVIKTRLREDISKPLFMNAYNADLKIRGEEKLPVVISKVHTEMLDGYFSGIRQKIPMYYREMKQKIKSDDYVRDSILRSSQYLEGEEMTITAADIAEHRQFLKERIAQYEAEDIAIVARAQGMFQETVAKFGEK